MQRDTSTQIVLQGLPHRLAVAGWFAIAIVSLLLLIFYIPDEFRFMVSEPTEFDAVMAQLGLTRDFWAGYQLTLDVLRILTFAALGLLLFWRKNHDGAALLTSIMLMTFGMYVTTFFADQDLDLPVVTSAPVLEGLRQLMRAVANIMFVIFLLVMPDGKFSPRWTIIFAILWVPYVILWVLFKDFPFSPAVWAEEYIFWLTLTGYMLGFLVQEIRERIYYNKSQLQQIKIIRFGLLVALIGGYGVASALPLFFPDLGGVGLSAFIYALVRDFVVMISVSAIPVGITLAILRYGLWDIDFLINKSVVYGVISSLIVGIFAGLLFGLQAIFQTINNGQMTSIAVAITAVLFGMIFQPLRRWTQRLVDRFLYGIKVDYERAYSLRKPVEPSTQAGLNAVGSYDRLTLVGRGGMAEIYRAQHPNLGQVAIKVLPEALAQQENFRRRFEREAKFMESLKHPNIVQYYEHGLADNTHYMVLEYVDGSDLGEVIKQKSFSMDETLSILKQVASALDYAHGQGLVHRDIKPSNVILESGSNGTIRRAVLTDFGIARTLKDAARLTDAGLVGTVDYISPEQIKESANVDARADVYSLGVMAFQMLTGHLPFFRQNPGAVILAHLQQPAPDPRSMRADLSDSAVYALMRSLEKSPDNRFRSAGEMISAMAV